MHSKYILKQIPSTALGNYKLFGGYGEVIGVCKGIVTGKKHISFKSFISQETYIITKDNFDLYLILKKDELPVSVKFYNKHKKIVVHCLDGCEYRIFTNDFRKTYNIKIQDDEIGIVSKQYKDSLEIGIAIREKANIDYVIAGIIALAYDIDSDPLTRF